MKIRLMGSQEECAAAVDALRGNPGLAILEVSAPYPNRRDSRQVRVYVEAQIVYSRAALRPGESGGG